MLLLLHELVSFFPVTCRLARAPAIQPLLAPQIGFNLPVSIEILNSWIAARRPDTLNYRHALTRAELSKMKLKSIISLFYFLFFLPSTSLSTRYLGPNNICGRTTTPSLHSLRSDQLTVLINGYSESRIPLLSSIAATYATSAIVSSVLILWGNPTTPSRTLTQLSHNLSSFGAQITVHPQRSTSLNSRFQPRPNLIFTRSILICDDDIEVDLKTLEFAFRVWLQNPNSLIGLFTRSHDLDLTQKSWIYTVNPDKYSIILTKFMILKTDYLHSYTCKDEYTEARVLVDRMRNCEDILMNFVAASETETTGPATVMVGAKKVRDWGDARNDGAKEETVVGLSGTERGRGEHRKKRGECITEFHRLLGKMPLRYGYGKVVDVVGEQGLCDKGGKLVPCDEQIELV